MLKKETLSALSKLLGIDNLAEAIADEKEVDIEIPTAELYSPEDIEKLKTNEYKRGGQAAVEIAVKDFKTKSGLDFTGKSLEGLIEAASKKALEEAKVEPAKKVTELEEKLKTVTATANEYKSQLDGKEQEIARVKLHTDLVKNVPQGTLLEADEVVTLMQAKGYEFKTESGKLVAYKDGAIVADKLAEPVAVADVIKGFAVEKKLIVQEGGDPGGRGGGNRQPAGGAFSKASELAKKFKDEGKSLMGQEFADALRVAAEANKEFELDMDKI